MNCPMIFMLVALLVIACGIQEASASLHLCFISGGGCRNLRLCLESGGINIGKMGCTWPNVCCK
uniref:Uncharacterized protein n=2 Tax=Hucho hucho TaxID=62062 RepID=A0A4W5MKP6_9TELE